jgi:23S rRNA (cytosine1962-C5)-methyltransferase
LSYELIDSGGGEKLERIGPFTIIRPSLISHYKPTNHPLWKEWDAKYTKNNTGSGSWEFRKKIPEKFTIDYSNLKVLVKLTPFGHLGFFPEQKRNWDRIRNYKTSKPLRVLNLFAYSGLGTLSCLQAGWEVCHVDASQGMVDWARENSKLNQLDHLPCRWIVDDVRKFLKRELNRESYYDGFFMDPPTFGRGKKGEIWKIEEDIGELIQLLALLTKRHPKIAGMTNHSQGFSPMNMKRMLEGEMKLGKNIILEEMTVPETTGKELPAGFGIYCEE